MHSERLMSHGTFFLNFIVRMCEILYWSAIYVPFSVNFMAAKGNASAVKESNIRNYAVPPERGRCAGNLYQTKPYGIPSGFFDRRFIG